MKLLIEMIDIMENVDATEMLLKLRKNSTGFLNAKKLELVCAAIGWKVDKKVMLFKVDHFDNAFRDSLKGDSNDGYVRVEADYSVGHGKLADADSFEKNGMMRAMISNYNGKKDEDAIKSMIYDMYGKIKGLEVSDFPTTLKKKHYYVKNLTEPQRKDYPGGIVSGYEYSFKFEAWWSNTGYIITDKTGKKTFELSNDYVANNHQISDFLRWAEKETEWKQDILDTLGMESHEATKRAERTRENTGTCGVCGSEQKLKNGTLVMHGYQRPGHGYLEGSCFGVGYEAFEKSSAACVAWIKELKKMLATREVTVQNYKAGKIKELSFYDTRTRVKSTVKEGDPTWDKVFKNRLDGIEREVEYIKKDIEMYEKKVATWKEQDLPWEKIQARLNKGTSK